MGRAFPDLFHGIHLVLPRTPTPLGLTVVEPRAFLLSLPTTKPGVTRAAKTTLPSDISPSPLAQPICELLDFIFRDDSVPYCSAHPYVLFFSFLQLFDVDEDGYITEEEFTTILQAALGVPDLDVSGLFKEIAQGDSVSYGE